MSLSLENAVNRVFLFSEERLLDALTEICFDSTKHLDETNPETQKWVTCDRTNWVSGFFAGSMWFLFERTRDPKWEQYARMWTADLEPVRHDTSNHDVGFQTYCSYGNGYRLTGDPDYREVLLTAAKSLSTRYDPVVGCTRSWDWGTWNYPVIIDNMMNLELLFWAAKNGGERLFYDIAFSHAWNTMLNHVREDGSTYHVVDYNDDGTLRHRGTYQGYADESTWSRGQAWAIYGFTMTYRETGDVRFLDTAIKCADFFLGQLPSNDYIPMSDFDTDLYKDASAAAVAVSALLELNNYVSESLYWETAVRMLKSLIGPGYLSEGTRWSCILLRNARFFDSKERGYSWGDYYLLKALSHYASGSHSD